MTGSFGAIRPPFPDLWEMRAAAAQGYPVPDSREFEKRDCGSPPLFLEENIAERHRTPGTVPNAD